MNEADLKLVDSCIREFARMPARAKVLDFGCGEGQFVQALEPCGYDSVGCDISARWPAGDGRFKLIQQGPYRLPYDDETFDVVFSTGVFEHVVNKEESLTEICRVLKKGGVTIHIFPSKYYLPYEPHLYVPFLNYLWPWTPRAYLTLWALLGVRNTHQRRMSWREVVNENDKFCRERLAYWPISRYRKCVEETLGECDFPTTFLAERSGGRAARVARTLFGTRVGGILLALLRYQLLVARKAA